VAALKTTKIFNVAMDAMLGDTNATGLPDHSFDSILSVGLLEHFTSLLPQM